MTKKAQLRIALFGKISRRLATIAIAVCLPMSVWADDEQRSPAKPNFVIILADDLGMGDVSFSGGTISTPNLDALAERGMTFSDFNTNGANCSPTRAALLTGRYQQRSGISGVIMNKPGSAKDKHPGLGLGKDEFTYADALHTVGYENVFFGKWHVGFQKEHHPLRHGFDENIGGSIGYFSRTHPRTKFVDWWKGEKSLVQERYTTHLITMHTVEYINRKKDTPFSVYVSYTAPHTPIQGPDPAENESASKEVLYPKMIEEIDKGVGEIVEAIKANGIEENTLIIFTADNGHSKHSPGSAGIYRGTKGQVYEGGHRVPTVFVWPGRIKAGSSSDQMAATFDLMPTMMDMAGAKLPTHLFLDGVSLKDLLLNNTPLQARGVYWSSKGLSAFRRNGWKLVVDKTKTKTQRLYNFKTDPGEMKNLVGVPEFCTTVNQHRDFLRQWIAESNDNEAKSFTIAPHFEECDDCRAGPHAHPHE